MVVADSYRQTSFFASKVYVQAPDEEDDPMHRIHSADPAGCHRDRSLRSRRDQRLWTG